MPIDNLATLFHAVLDLIEKFVLIDDPWFEFLIETGVAAFAFDNVINRTVFEGCEVGEELRMGGFA